MIKKYITAFIAFVYLNTALIAQDIIPMSPNAAALATYADYPVSHYTGVPNIDIPLYEIEVDGFKLPISLSYHSKGIQLSQEASWVGLGWALNAGGAISRTIKCEDDFNGYSRMSHSVCQTGWYDDPNPLELNENVADACNTSIKMWGYTLKGQSPCENYHKYICHNNFGSFLYVDTEPDIFYYSLPHLSGKFIYNKSQTPVFFNKEHNIIIKRNGFDFIVTDANGIQYIFNNQETIKGYSSETSDFTFENIVTSWLLSKIITPNGNEINFYYQSENIRSPMFESYNQSTVIYGNIPQFAINCSVPGFDKYSYSIIEHQSMRLSRIEWKNGYITFSALNNREDLRTNSSKIPKRLDKMNVYGQNGELLKSFDFQYDYFSNSNYTANQYLYKRLKLTNVTEKDKNNNPLNNGYSLEYFEGNMPAKNSGSKDYWGYINKSTDADVEILGTKKIRIASMIEGKFYCNENTLSYLGGRYPMSVFDFLKRGTLNKILLPTGGSTDFEYEENTYEYNNFFKTITKSTIPYSESVSPKGGGLRIRRITTGNKERIFEYYGGKMLVQPPLIRFMVSTCSYNNVTLLNQIQSTNVSRSFSTLKDGNEIGYNKVKETVTDGIDYSATEYEFYNKEEEELNPDATYNMDMYTRIDFKNGLLLNKKLYNSNALVQETQYDYTEKDEASIVCYKATDNELQNGTRYQYDIKSISKRQEITKNYFVGKELVEENYFYYNDFLQLVWATKKDADNKYVVKVTKYPKDVAENDQTRDMLSKNLLNLPFEEVVVRDSQVISAKKVDYIKLACGKYVPSTIYQMQTSTPLTLSSYSSAYQPVMYYENYNAQGKVQQVRTPGLTSVYLWSYKGDYPVVEVKGATYEQVNAILTESFITDLINTTEPSAEQMALLNALRERLPNAMISTYTYKPLIGMQTVTNPRGITTTYTYDEFQRLKDIVDYNGKLLKNITYHYKE